MSAFFQIVFYLKRRAVKRLLLFFMQVDVLSCH